MRMRKKELRKILKLHEKWLNGEPDGKRADLSGKNLSKAFLRCANLQKAIMRNVNLESADLAYTNLNEADLSGANLEHTDLYRSTLKNTTLYGANLHKAYCHGANFNNCNLSNSNMEKAMVCFSDMKNANLKNVNFKNVNLHNAMNLPDIDYPYVCPEMGSFIGYKAVMGENSIYIAKLEIPEDAKRVSGTSNKCRCNKAKVLSFFTFDGDKVDITKANSIYDSDFIYELGKIVEESNFDENRWEECSEGIHFFMSLEEAAYYVLPFKLNLEL